MPATKNKYILITVRDIIRIEIKEQQFPTREEAYQEMKNQLRIRMRLDLPEDEVNANMTLMEDGVEISNAELKENSAYIYQDVRDTWHHWKIIEVTDETVQNHNTDAHTIQHALRKNFAAWCAWTDGAIQDILKEHNVEPSAENVKAFCDFTGNCIEDIDAFIVQKCKTEGFFS